MPRLQKSLERPRKAARQPRPKELSEKHRKDEPQSIQPMWRHLIWAAATAAASRRDEPRFAALACHERRPWCVASEPDEDRLLAVDLAKKDVVVVWSGRAAPRTAGSVRDARLVEPRGLALARNGSILLVGTANGLRALDVATLAVRRRRQSRPAFETTRMRAVCVRLRLSPTVVGVSAGASVGG